MPSHSLPTVSLIDPLDEEFLSEHTIHRATEEQSDQHQLYNYWNFHIQKGYQKHKGGCIPAALKAFQEGVKVGLLIMNLKQNEDCDFNAMDLIYTASHNLAACYNKLGHASKGETILDQTYQLIVKQCGNDQLTQSKRLEALTTLDKSLFSLISQRAYMGNLINIHKLIKDTERFAVSVVNSISC
jgi:hypothetical protein